MGENQLDERLDRLLDAIEAREQRALRWGYTGASLSEDEVVALASPIAGSDVDPEELVGLLLERALLMRVSVAGRGQRYRSRFAEGVRLLTSLRQLFPRHSSWLAAPTLVSDFRLDRRPRRYPKRDVEGEQAVGALAQGLGWSTRQRSVAAALIAGESGPLSLSAFQVRACEAVCGGNGSDAGVFISAGTGSGKTLAYYLPAYVLAADLVQSGQFWTKSVSIYPRNELLKDQFTEAYRLARAVSQYLPRPLRLGTFFGPTPPQPRVNDIARDWDAFGPAASPRGYVCPFLHCPKCRGRMVWPREALANGTEKLVCENSLSPQPTCDVDTRPEELALTRASIQRQPADFLFTTVETLNQRMSDGRSRAIFGLGVSRRPSLLLLDEAHSFEGIAGAQAALVIRRWRYAVGAPVLRIGLSATLTDAQRFFAQVAGVPDYAVREVTPRPDEYESDAAEYQLILRGDPVSRAALLSTSIQAGFLLARLMDKHPVTSRDRIGQRLFVFTDDLDVTNRLYDDLRDAERYGAMRRPLAALRARSDDQRRFSAGQDWRAIEAIGWDLSEPLNISRTSSQDAGVDRGSQVVVATSALEVGFNDDRVGAVLQHKSPYRESSFIQRKGRAGRKRKMRPWTVTVLSDYGRDRFTYQAYETLFAPLLPAQRLPVDNLYVLRIQASFCAIEWLASQHPDLKDWWWWTINGPQPTGTSQSRQQNAAIETITRLLDGDEVLLESLRGHIRDSLGVSAEVVDSILFQAPRSVLLEFLPTLLRRLQTHWRLARKVGDQALDLVYEGGPPHPVPEFLPPNLFTDLNLPEVTLRGPQIDAGASMMVDQALRQFAPGRITRRFAHKLSGLYHWIPVPVDRPDEPYRLPVDQYAADYRLVAMAPVVMEDEVREIPIFRPWLIELQEAATTQSRAVVRRGGAGSLLVLPSSNAQLNWQSQLLPAGEPLAHSTEYDRTWRRALRAIEFYTHSRRSPVSVRRFAMSAQADIRARSPQGTTRHMLITTEFCDPGHPEHLAAIGFESDVDAVCFQFHLPSAEELAVAAADAAELPARRTAYLRYLILTDKRLPPELNQFLRDWVYQVYLAALIELAVESGIDLPAANAVLHEQGTERFEAVLNGIFQTGNNEESEDDADTLRTELRSVLADGHVLRLVGSLATQLWAPDTPAWGRWLRRSLHETLAQGVASACLEIAPEQVAEESLLIDLDRGVPDADNSPDQVEVWLTETAIGGAGTVEAILSAYVENPRRLFRALEAAFAPGTNELTSERLRRVLQLSQSDAELREMLRRTRAAAGPIEREAELRNLFRVLGTRGVFFDHSLSVALNQRLLREGTDEDTDKLLNDLVSHWADLERRLNVSMDLRVFSYLAVRSPAFAPRIEAMLGRGAGEAGTTADAVGVISGLLWASPAEMRRTQTGPWSPYREHSFSDAALVRAFLLNERITSVSLEESDWPKRLREELGRTGKVELLAPADKPLKLQHEIGQLIATPVEDGFLQFYPSIDQVRYRDGTIGVTFRIQTLA